MKNIFQQFSLTLLLLLVVMSSCEDRLKDYPKLTGERAPGSTTQSFGNGIEVYSAKSFNRNIFLLASDMASDTKIHTYYHDYNTLKDGFPILREGPSLPLKYQIWNSGELVVWGDRLFCVYHAQYNIGMGYYDNRIETYEVIQDPLDPIKYKLSGMHGEFLPIKKTGDKEGGHISFSLAEMDGYLYAAILIKDSNKIRLYRTATTEPSFEPTWQSLGYIKKSANADDEIFDNGVENFKLRVGTIYKNGGTVSTLYFCRQRDKSHVEVYRFDEEGSNKWTYFESEMTSKLSGMGTFDVVQGSIAGSGQDANSVPLQLICSKGDYVVAQAFHPENGGRFGGATYLKNHNGRIAATMGFTAGENENAYYTHLYMFIGAHGVAEKMDVDRYQSNTIQVLTSHRSLIDDWMTDTTFRKMCTLMGVIEGPPPTMISNEADFNAITFKLYPQLLLRAKSITSCEFSHGFAGGVGVHFGYGYDNTKPVNGESGRCTASANIGFNFNYEFQNKESKMTYVQKDYTFSTSYETRKYGILLYMVPSVETTAYYMSKPMSPQSSKSTRSVINDDMIWEDAFQFKIVHDDVSLIAVNMDITKPPFSIQDPNDIRSWQNRIDEVSDNGYQTPLRGGQIKLDGPQTSISIGGSNSITNIHSWNLGFKFDWNVAVKLGAKKYHTASVGGGFSGQYKGNKMLKNELSTDISMIYPMIESKNISDLSIKEFYSAFMISYDKRSNAAKKYYQPLIDMEYMLPDEEPWILQYQVEGIK